MFGIFYIAGCETVVIDHFVKCAAAFHIVGIVVAEFLKRFKNGFAVSGVIRLVVFMHVLHVPYFIVTDHHEVTGFVY